MMATDRSGHPRFIPDVDPDGETRHDPKLIQILREAGDRWGPLGVVRAAASLLDPGVLRMELVGVPLAPPAPPPDRGLLAALGAALANHIAGDPDDETTPLGDPSAFILALGEQGLTVLRRETLAEIALVVAVEYLPAGRVDTVEAEIMEVLARHGLSCSTLRKALDDHPEGWEDAHLEQLRAAENAAADAREERDMAVAQVRDLADAARAVADLHGPGMALSGLSAVDGSRYTLLPGADHVAAVQRLREVLADVDQATEPAVPLRDRADGASGVGAGAEDGRDDH